MNDTERWQTPPEIFDPLMAEFAFDLDAAADMQTRRVDRFVRDALNGEPWRGERVWLNPPYGRKLEPFVRRAADEADLGKLVVALIPFRCRAAWWHEAVLGRAAEVRCVRKRVRFVRPDGSRGNFTGSCDSCIVIWRGPRRFRTIGGRREPILAIETVLHSFVPNAARAVPAPETPLEGK